MNWIVHNQNKTVTEEWDHCEHLSVGDIAPQVVGEQDSFGPVARYGMCEACYETYLEEQGEEKEICHDCGESKFMKDMFEWRWYGFYAPQGDEPLIICDECGQKPKHVNRVRRDRESMLNDWDDD